jgi:hypothetical protein
MGPAGATGIPGATGPPGWDGDEPEALLVPGPAGPQGPAGGGGGLTLTAIVKDLGAARSAGSFDVTGLAGLTAGKPVLVIQTAAAVASKGDARDEAELDQVKATGYVVDATTIRVYWQAPSVVVGDVAFGYAVSG